MILREGGESSVTSAVVGRKQIVNLLFINLNANEVSFVIPVLIFVGLMVVFLSLSIWMFIEAASVVSTTV